MKRQLSWRRNGSAAVELAFCMPFILVLVVGAVELSGGLYHQHSLRTTVHECAIAAARGGSEGADVRAVAAQILSQREMSDFDIDIDVMTRTVNADSVDPPAITHFDIPATGLITQGLGDLPRGTLLRLTITVDRPPNRGFGMSNAFLGTQIQAECFFVKEI